MTDITTKLRQGQCSFELNGEACREIDRLRAELDGYREANKHLVAELDAANAYASDLNDSLIAAIAEVVALEAERDALRAELSAQVQTTARIASERAMERLRAERAEARIAAIDNAPTVARSTFVRGEICGCQTRPTHYVGEIDCPWHKRGDGQPKEPT